MTLTDIRGTKRDEILRLAAEHGAGNVRVFGSTARGNQRPESDIDLSVDLESNRSLMDLGGLGGDLGQFLGTSRGVPTRGELKPRVPVGGVARAVRRGGSES